MRKENIKLKKENLSLNEMVIEKLEENIKLENIIKDLLKPNDFFPFILYYLHLLDIYF